jgi:hypothetical protein
MMATGGGGRRVRNGIIFGIGALVAVVLSL